MLDRESARVLNEARQAQMRINRINTLMRELDSLPSGDPDGRRDGLQAELDRLVDFDGN